MLPYRIPNLKDKRLQDPHVVIVGAGASIAACKFDKNGRQVPLLRNIHHVLGLSKKLEEYGFSEQEMADFELLFSNIYGKTEHRELQEYLENKVFEYFSRLCIPDTPTYYDYLILSLTSKDCIISFNWDPFLLQAYKRNTSVGNLPEVVFPHGNAGVGVCYGCKVKGYAGAICPKCGRPLENMPLLFPIGKKNYGSEIIRNEWAVAKQRLSVAAGITVYGYGAPVTDVEAMELMKGAYSESRVKEIAPFTIINLPMAEQEQREKWGNFFDPTMILYCDSLEKTMLWQNPRVSLETLFDAILQQHPRERQEPYSRFDTLEELQRFAGGISAFDMHL